MTYTDDDVSLAIDALFDSHDATYHVHASECCIDAQYARAVLDAVAPAIAARALREAADEYVKGIYPECGFVESFLHDLAERAEAVGE